MRSRSSAPAEPTPRAATTAHLLGDRVVCAFCERADFAVHFIDGGVPLCEDCESAGFGSATQREA